MAPEAVRLTSPHPVMLLEGQAGRAGALGQRPRWDRTRRESPALVLERMGAGAGPWGPGNNVGSVFLTSVLSSTVATNPCGCLNELELNEITNWVPQSRGPFSMPVVTCGILTSADIHHPTLNTRALPSSG